MCIYNIRDEHYLLPTYHSVFRTSAESQYLSRLSSLSMTDVYDRINLKLIWGRLRDFQARSLERQSLRFFTESSHWFSIFHLMQFTVEPTTAVERPKSEQVPWCLSHEVTPKVLSWPETFWIILRVCGIFVQISETRPDILDFSCSSNWPKPCYNLDCLNYVLLERIWKGKYFFWIRRSS